MASTYHPKKNTAYVFKTGLVDRSNRPDFLVNPTMTGGDFVVVIDTQGTVTNMATLPTALNATNPQVLFNLNTTEMNGDRISVIGVDSSSTQTWDDIFVEIPTVERQITEDGGIDSASLATDMDSYQGKVILIDDDTGTTDRYTITWFKNSEPITSGITSPTIQVIKVSDGTDLVANTAMTEIASLGMYKFTETTNRVISGDDYVVKCQASIGGATRTWLQQVGRDD